MPGTLLSAGGLAVIGYNTSMSDGTGNPALLDKISFVLTTDIAAGTQFFLTDRSWNGTSFSVNGSDGTYTYTAGAAMSAGTVITLTQTDFSGAGVDFDFVNGEAVYIYQGSDANTPTSFITALEAGDGNTTFNASLVNTGLSTSAGTAEAFSFDTGAYAGPTTYAGSYFENGAGTTLLQSIADANNWTGSDQTGQNAIEQHVQTGPWFTSADMDMWGTSALGGGGIVHVGFDSTVSTGSASFNTSDLYNNLIVSGTSQFWNLRDMVFDTVDGKFFVVDSDITGGHNRIFQGNIADLLSNPGIAPTLTQLYSDTGTTTASRLDNLEVDTANNLIYFTHGSQLIKVGYNTANQAGTVLFDANAQGSVTATTGNPAGSTSNFFNDMAVDFTTGHIYLSSTRVGASSGGDVVSKNFIYDLSGLTSSSGAGAFTMNGTTNTGTARLLPFVQNDDAYNPVAGTTSSPATSSNQAYFFAQELGTLDGLAIDPTTHTLYFSTGEILFDHDGDGDSTDTIYEGGVVASYALTGNPTGAITVLFQQPAQSSGAIPGLMGDLEIDTVTGKYYVTDTVGASGTVGTDQYIWSGSLTTPGTPTAAVTDLNSVNSLTTTGMTINHAPTLSGTNLTPGVTEQSDGPPSTETSQVGLFSGVSISDVDTSGGDEISGAVVRISSGFLAGATHQDYLRINGLTSGTIAASGIGFTYNSTTGAMVLTGAATVAEYQSAIQLVTFSTSGDDPTHYGNDTSRTIAASVTDGLSFSDEITATVSITGINDKPVNTAGSDAAVTEDITANITGVSVFDVDADPAAQNITVTLSVAHGTISLLTNVSGGIVSGNITSGANGSGTVTLTATQNQINATLAAVGGLTYAPTADYNGSDNLHIVTNDGGLNGTGGALSDTDDKAINVSAVTDIANDTVTVAEDSGANTLNLLANDTFENATRFISSVTQGAHGTVTINDNNTVGDTTDDFVVYTPDANYNGSDSFTYTVTSPAGVTETATANVTVTAVNDPVTGAAPASISLNEDSVSFAVSGLSISDVDATLAPAGVYEVTLSSTHGTLTMTTLTGLTFTAGDGTADTTMTFHGTLADLNTALATASYTPTADYNGVDASGIVLQVTDTFGGVVATGTGAATSDSDSVSVTVVSVNDAPTSTNLDGDSVTWTEGDPAVHLDVGGNATISDIDSPDFDTGTLTVAITAGGASGEDVLTINDEGTLAGQIGVSGSNVTYGGTTIGTFTGGSGGVDLVVTFNANADTAATQALIHNIEYNNTGGDNPTDGDRTITWTLVDGDGTANGGHDTLTATTMVNVNPVDDAPVAQDDSFSTNENAIISASVLTDNGHGADSDPDGPPVQVGDVNGSPGDVGVPVAQSSGALLTVNSDGSFSYDPNGQFDYLVSAAKATATGAVNSSATDTFTYSLVGGNTATATVTINGVDNAGDELRGDAGVNSITGTGGGDFINLSQGGDDTANGGLGDDGFYMGAAFSSADHLAGGGGFDDVGLQGNYGSLGSPVVFDPATLTDMDLLALLSGSDTRFGDTAGNLYDYYLTTDDGNVASGQELVVSWNTLTAGEDVVFDGSAETDGTFLTYGGFGSDTITGGQQDDGFYFGYGRWGASDSVDGQGGTMDQLGLQGDYTAAGSGAITFGASQLTGIEMIVCLTGGDNRFGAPPGVGYSYDLTMDDGNVGAGQTLYVSANTLHAAGGTLTSDETLTFDGSAETDGSFTVYSGAGADSIVGGAGGDTLYGGAGDDAITGGLGADQLHGGTGNDTFFYAATTESTAVSEDQIFDFASGDHIDLSAIDADTVNGGQQGFTFIGSSAFSSTAGELRAFEQTTDHWVIQGDTDGNGAADLVIAVTVSDSHPLTTGDFVI
jgi:hypothetical protein